jgi:hypothetical protein
MIEEIKKMLWASADKLRAELDQLIRQKLGGLGYEF